MAADPWTATLAVIDALDAARVPCAIGGSLAMAAVGYVRATQDGDVNVFVPMTDAGAALTALRAGGLAIDVEAAAREAAERGDGRVYVDGIRVDLFFDSIPLHRSAASRTRSIHFAGRTVRVLAPEDLVVLKALFNRGKDWLDVERLIAALGPDFDRAYCRAQLVDHAGPDDATVVALDRIFEAWPLAT